MRIEDLVDTMNWMVTDMTHRHDTCGNPNNYSPELSKAIDLLQTLRHYEGGFIISPADLKGLQTTIRMLASKIGMEPVSFHPAVSDELIERMTE
jgi:hypothetical protein